MRKLTDMSISELHEAFKLGNIAAADELNRREHAIKANNAKRPAGKIDLTPTWKGVLPIIIAALEDGTPEGKRLAKLELAQMAKAADLYNASVPPMTDDAIKNSNTPEAQEAARKRMSL
jgi:hypothetical protein